MFKKTISIFVIFAMLSVHFLQHVPMAQANVQGVLNTGLTGISGVKLQGIQVYPDHPFKMDFLMSHVDQLNQYSDNSLEDEAQSLVRYFLAALTTPSTDMWVNLSPDEPERIIAEGFGETQMGRDLLAQDYILKQLTSSLMTPETQTGDAFWTRVYSRIYETYGDTDLSQDIFHRVWIVPHEAEVYVLGTQVFIQDRQLKVLSEDDYLEGTDSQSPIFKEILQEIVIPELEREVNQGEHFIKLRQIYDALILAVWYKRNLTQSLLGQNYVDQSKNQGVEFQDQVTAQNVFENYVSLFKEGVYRSLREEYDPVAQDVVVREYVLGGADYAMTSEIVEETVADEAMIRKVILDLPDMVTAKFNYAVDTSKSYLKFFGALLGILTVLGVFLISPSVQAQTAQEVFSSEGQPLTEKLDSLNATADTIFEEYSQVSDSFEALFSRYSPQGLNTMLEAPNVNSIFLNLLKDQFPVRYSRILDLSKDPLSVKEDLNIRYYEEDSLSRDTVEIINKTFQDEFISSFASENQGLLLGFFGHMVADGKIMFTYSKEKNSKNPGYQISRTNRSGEIRVSLYSDFFPFEKGSFDEDQRKIFEEMVRSVFVEILKRNLKEKYIYQDEHFYIEGALPHILFDLIFQSFKKQEELTLDLIKNKLFSTSEAVTQWAEKTISVFWKIFPRNVETEKVFWSIYKEFGQQPKDISLEAFLDHWTLIEDSLTQIDSLEITDREKFFHYQYAWVSAVKDFQNLDQISDSTNFEVQDSLQQQVLDLLRDLENDRLAKTASYRAKLLYLYHIAPSLYRYPEIYRIIRRDVLSEVGFRHVVDPLQLDSLESNFEKWRSDNLEAVMAYGGSENFGKAPLSIEILKNLARTFMDGISIVEPGKNVKDRKFPQARLADLLDEQLILSNFFWFHRSNIIDLFNSGDAESVEVQVQILNLLTILADMKEYISRDDLFLNSDFYVVHYNRYKKINQAEGGFWEFEMYRDSENKTYRGYKIEGDVLAQELLENILNQSVVERFFGHDVLSTLIESGVLDHMGSEWFKNFVRVMDQKLDQVGFSVTDSLDLQKQSIQYSQDLNHLLQMSNVVLYIHETRDGGLFQDDFLVQSFIPTLQKLLYHHDQIITQVPDLAPSQFFGFGSVAAYLSQHALLEQDRQDALDILIGLFSNSNSILSSIAQMRGKNLSFYTRSLDYLMLPVMNTAQETEFDQERFKKLIESYKNVMRIFNSYYSTRPVQFEGNEYYFMDDVLRTGLEFHDDWIKWYENGLEKAFSGNQDGYTLSLMVLSFLELIQEKQKKLNGLVLIKDEAGFRFVKNPFTKIIEILPQRTWELYQDQTLPRETREMWRKLLEKLEKLFPEDQSTAPLLKDRDDQLNEEQTASYIEYDYKYNPYSSFDVPQESFDWFEKKKDLKDLEKLKEKVERFNDLSLENQQTYFKNIWETFLGLNFNGSLRGNGEYDVNLEFSQFVLNLLKTHPEFRDAVASFYFEDFVTTSDNFNRKLITWREDMGRLIRPIENMTASIESVQVRKDEILPLLKNIRFHLNKKYVSPKKSIESDNASLNENVGGIDFNDERLNIQESGDSIQMDAGMLNVQGSIQNGLTPVLIRIIPGVFPSLSHLMDEKPESNKKSSEIGEEMSMIFKDPDLYYSSNVQTS